MYLLPKTGPGKWAFLAFLGVIVGTGLLFTAIAAGEKGGETFSDNWLLAGPGPLAAASGVVSLFLGLATFRRTVRRAKRVWPDLAPSPATYGQSALGPLAHGWHHCPQEEVLEG